MSHNRIEDLSPLAELKDLHELYLDDNQLSEISDLSLLRAPALISLKHNQISDLSPLASLKTVSLLYLSHNEISDISPLSGLMNLWQLDLSNNEISNISPLSELINLRELDLSNNEISDISILRGVLSLDTVNLEGNPLDLSPGSETMQIIRRTDGQRCDSEVLIPGPNPWYNVLKFVLGGNTMKKPAGIMIVLLLMLVFAAAGSAQEAETYSTYEGRVLTVEALEPQPFAEEGWENQLVTVKLLSGPDKGREVQILHTLTGHPYFDLRVPGRPAGDPAGR